MDKQFATYIASLSLKGKTDKAGQSIYNHSIRVHNGVSTEDQKIVAILHEVIEDGGLDLDYLRAKGFSDEIVAAVDAISRRDGEVYEVYILRCERDPIAREVKKADLIDNLNLTRLDEVTSKDVFRSVKYLMALLILIGMPKRYTIKGGKNDPK